MAINPQIPLAVRPLDVGQAFSNALLNVDRMQQMRQRAAQSDLVQQQGAQQLQQRDLMAAVQLAGPIRSALEQGDMGTAQSLIGRLPASARDEAMGLFQQGDTQQLISLASQLEGMAPQLGIKGQNTGLASAKTEIYDNGTVLQALPDNTTIVRDPSGRIVEGQERVEVLEKARREQVAFAGDRAAAAARGTAGVELETAPRIAAEVEDAKLDVQSRLVPKLRADIKRAEAEAESRGQALSEFRRAEIAMPALQEVVSSLRELAPIATSTVAGKIFDVAAKELGFGSTKGATARAKYSAIIDNQILPLLKQTFGAAFTAVEGERLRDTLGDPDASPAEKAAQLDAFIDSKVRELETARRAVNAGIEQGSQPGQSGQTGQQQGAASGPVKVGRFTVEVE